MSLIFDVWRRVSWRFVNDNGCQDAKINFLCILYVAYIRIKRVSVTVHNVPTGRLACLIFFSTGSVTSITLTNRSTETFLYIAFKYCKMKEMMVTVQLCRWSYGNNTSTLTMFPRRATTTERKWSILANNSRGAPATCWVLKRSHCLFTLLFLEVSR